MTNDKTDGRLRASERSTGRVEVRVTQRELESWRTAAEWCGLTLSEWVREQARLGIVEGAP
jgi:hypothetical protein